MRTTFFSLMILSAFSFVAHSIFAQCACHPPAILAEQVQRADAIFVGKVVEAKKIPQRDIDGYDVIIRFEVKQTWKQDLEKFVIVKEFHGSTDGFEPNAEWLLYANRNADGTFGIVRHCCSRTKTLSVGQEDLKVFKTMGLKPKQILETK